jgi:hypothetical protein
MSKDNEDNDVKSKIMSLADKRKKKTDQARKTYLPLEQRVAELEADLIRIIDSLADLDYIINNHARVNRLLVKALSNIASRIPDAQPEKKP